MRRSRALSKNDNASSQRHSKRHTQPRSEKSLLALPGCQPARNASSERCISARLPASRARCAQRPSRNRLLPAPPAHLQPRRSDRPFSPFERLRGPPRIQQQRGGRARSPARPAVRLPGRTTPGRYQEPAQVKRKASDSLAESVLIERKLNQQSSIGESIAFHQFLGCRLGSRRLPTRLCGTKRPHRLMHAASPCSFPGRWGRLHARATARGFDVCVHGFRSFCRAIA